MQVITSIQAKSLLPQRTRAELRDYLNSINNHVDKISVDSFYLGYLCARGTINDAASFLGRLGARAAEVINFPHEQFYFGTALHMALCWNSGNLGLDFFELLWSHGAEYYRDHYEQYPWAQVGEKLWVSPIDHSDASVLGQRDESEFLDMYEQLRETYGLIAYENEEDEETDEDEEDNPQAAPADQNNQEYDGTQPIG